MGVLCGKDEKWVNWTAIDVENVLCAGEAGELCYVSLEVWKCGSYGQTALVFLPINTDCNWYGFGWVVRVDVERTEDWWIGCGGYGDG